MACRWWLGAARALLFTVIVHAAVLGAGDAMAAQLTLSWLDNSGGTAYTRIERRLGTDAAFTAIADASPGATTYVDTAVQSGAVYCYRIFAWDSTSVSYYTSEVCATATVGGAVGVAVSRNGNGTGTVVSAPAGITCGAVCSAAYGPGTWITLAATPAPGSVFSGWSGGGCAGTAPCTFVGNVTVAVTATFTLAATSPTPTAPISDYLRWVQSLPPGSATDPNDPILQAIYQRQVGGSSGFTTDYLAWVRGLPPGSATDPNDPMLQSIYAARTGLRVTASVASTAGVPSFESWVRSLPPGSSTDPSDPLLLVYYRNQFGL